MGRFEWCRRHLLSSRVGELINLNFAWSASRCGSDLLFSAYHTLYSCSFVLSEASAFATARTPSRKRFIHATGSLYSTERGYYEILNVPKDATREEIKKAFHALAKKYHPDANKNNPSAKRKFQEIRDAYETLQDSEKRAQYDREQIGGSENSKYSSRDSKFRYDYGNHSFDSFQKIFSEIFEEETANFASDIQVELSLSFSEAAKGCIKHVSFDSYNSCDSCYGWGILPDAKMSTCPTCRGLGRITVPPFTSRCRTCKGLGKIIMEPCMTCRGSGAIKGVKEVKVTIPEGVDNGATILIPKAGNAGMRGNQPGNLYIKLKVANDSIFSRDGANVYVDANIGLAQAILGGKVEVPTLSGKMQVKIPKAVQHGQLVVLRGKGFPQDGIFVDHGDQYVRFQIKFPSNLTERQRAILEEFAKEEITHGRSTSGEGNWWRQIIEHATRPDSLLKLSVFILILLFVSKTMS